MNDETKALYQEMILDHYKKPRNFEKLPHPTHQANGHNPRCGDKVTVFLELANDRVQRVSFQGSGCAISTASASMMTERLTGKTLAEAARIFDSFHDLLTKEAPGTTDDEDALGKLRIFEGVREFPMRVKCATLAWHTMKAACENQVQPISTEKP